MNAAERGLKRKIRDEDQQEGRKKKYNQRSERGMMVPRAGLFGAKELQQQQQQPLGPCLCCAQPGSCPRSSGHAVGREVEIYICVLILKKYLMKTM